MMSRYDDVPTTTFQTVSTDGARRLVTHYRRRFPPEPVRATLAEHTVVPADRLDLLSFRLTGDPLGFWRLCDANAALDPDDLVGDEAVGTVIVVPQPGTTR